MDVDAPPVAAPPNRHSRRSVRNRTVLSGALGVARLSTGACRGP